MAESKVNRERFSSCEFPRALLSAQYFYRTQVNSVGSILMGEESDSEVDYFYLSYLTGTKQEVASQDRFERGMKGGKCPPPPSLILGQQV